MMFTIQKTDRLALVGTGLALSVYRWLKENDFNCVGQLPGELLSFETSTEESSYLAKNLPPTEEALPFAFEVCSSTKGIDIILSEIPLNYIEALRFNEIMRRKNEINSDLKVIFFPRFDLPKRCETHQVQHFIEKLNNSLQNLQSTLEFSSKYSDIYFFPVHQLAFYLGLRTQVETGKNQSLEFVELAKDLFRHLYLFQEDLRILKNETVKCPDITWDLNFIGDSHMLNLLEVIHGDHKPDSLLMNGSEWDAQNFSFTSSCINIAPRNTRPLSRKTSFELPTCGKKILLTNVGTQSHCLHERLVDSMKINGINEVDLSYSDFIYAAIKNYRTKHLSLLSHLKGQYDLIIVLSDPPFQHFRIHEDGRKYEEVFKLIDNVLQGLCKATGCIFLNIRELIGQPGRAYDFLSNKTLSPTSDEIDWVHGNRAYYQFAWRETAQLISNLRMGKIRY